MLDIKPINTSAIPYQLETSMINQAPLQTNYSTSLNSTASTQCQHPFIDNLLNGLTNIILQTVNNIFQQIGFGGVNNTNSLAANNGNSLGGNNQSVVEKPSFLDYGIDFVSGLFGGKLSSILNIFKGEGSFLGKAKDLIGKLF